MERIPPQRADNGDLFRIPQVGLHTAHGGYGTVPDLRFAARARSILPFHRPAPRKRDLPRGFQPDQHPLAARRGDGTLPFPADRHKPHEIPPAAAPPRRMHDQPAAAELPGRGVSIHPRPLRRNAAVGYGRHAAAGHVFQASVRTPPAVQEAFQGAQTGRDRQKTGLKIWISGIFHYICQRLIHQGDNETLRFCILFLLLFLL